MIGDLRHFDLNKLWVYRMFAFADGLQLSSDKLHFQPIPVNLPTDRQHATIVRILHRSGMTACKRRERFEKYRQADPDQVWQSSYANLLAAPRHLWELRSHPEGVNLLL